MRTAVVVTLLVTLAFGARAQLPDTPAGHQLAGWVAAFNDGDRETLRRFLEVNAPADVGKTERVMRHALLRIDVAPLPFRAQTGGFDFRKIEESTPTRLAALFQEHASDQFARLTIQVDSAEPHHIASLTVQAVPRPPEFAIARLDDAALIRALRVKVNQEVAANRFAGAVLVAHHGHILFDSAYGLADRERRTPNTVNTRFRIGSMNKMFTAVAVLQLVQAGKVRLDAPLSTYLPDYPNRDVASKVTIHELLTHTGGTGDIFTPEFRLHRRELRSIGDYLKLYGSRGLAFEPGTRWEYSNYGFVLLGAVIERVSGQSYYDYVAAHVYAPAGMTSSGSEPEDSTVANRSVGYMRDDASGAWVPNTEMLPYRGMSAGGGYSTVGDLFRFAESLRAPKLLNAEYTELLTRGKVNARDSKYAYGFFDRMVDGMRFIGHGGGAPGMNGDLEIAPASDYVVAVLANVDPPAAQGISEFVIARLPAESAARRP